MEITDELLQEFKDKMHFSHKGEDSNLKKLLSFSIAAITRKVGAFNIEENEGAKELVFERARYAYNDAVEYFDKNFSSELNSVGFEIAMAQKEGDPDAAI